MPFPLPFATIATAPHAPPQAVCGLGLDTVPIAGDTSQGKLAALLLDVAALAFRLDKPLSARVFPVPGKAAGEATSFVNPYLCDTKVFEVP